MTNDGSLSWETIIRVALSAGVFGTILNISISRFIDWLIKAKSDKKKATYGALIVANALERFAVECAQIISDHIYAIESEENIESTNLTIHANLPELLDSSAVIDWTLLPIELMSKEADLRHSVIIANVNLRFVFSDLDGDHLVEEAAKQAALCGLCSWKLASEFRQRCNLPASGAINQRPYLVELLEDPFGKRRRNKNKART